jgi:hypothetical protein
MPRLRRSSPSLDLPTDRLDLREAPPVERQGRSVGDPLVFFRAIAEIERLRGLPVHPESPTRH